MSTLKQHQHREIGALALASSLARPGVGGPVGSHRRNWRASQHDGGRGLERRGNYLRHGCYLAAALCSIAGVWAIWASRQPQSRESGYLARGFAGLVLCGLFVTGGTWISRASVTAGGGTMTIDGTISNMVTFK